MLDPHAGSMTMTRSRRWLVVGVTSWGLALAQHLARQGLPVRMLARDETEAEIVRLRRTHPARITSVRLPLDVEFVSAPAVAAACVVIVLAVPAQAVRAALQTLTGSPRTGAVLVSAAKGIERETGLRMSELLGEACPTAMTAVLSGPNLAEEVSRGLPSTTVVASCRPEVALALQADLNSGRFRVYTHDDVPGVELGGALKNIIALGAGINDGLGFGDNAKAALMTRGLAEITRLGVAMGARSETFAGLSGLGDLVATCASPLSRNRRVGEELGRGRALDEVLRSLGHVAEGVATTAAAHMLAARHRVAMPIVEQMYRVLYEGLPAAGAADALMGREPRAEYPL
jgi:glycerol-3-phosphate dehydrogenase (NAD(P)+)